MLILDHLIELAVELLHAIFVDELSERVRKQARRTSRGRQLQGMNAVRRHIHRRCRENLNERLSTEK